MQEGGVTEPSTVQTWIYLKDFQIVFKQKNDTTGAEDKQHNENV